MAGLGSVAPAAAAAGDDIRATLPGGMADQTVIAASGRSFLRSSTARTSRTR